MLKQIENLIKVRERERKRKSVKGNWRERERKEECVRKLEREGEREYGNRDREVRSTPLGLVISKSRLTFELRYRLTKEHAL